MSMLKLAINLKTFHFMNKFIKLLKLLYSALILTTFTACAKDTTPLEGWEFVAVISKNTNGSVAVIVLKDDNKQFKKDEFMNPLRERFENMNPPGSTCWVYSLKFINGKRREILKSVDPQFFKDIERHFTPLSKPPKLP
jgi:hypothetical protein